ncbi:MAG TPA: tubulin-like doman-containing protein [Gemmataceae bacterium]|nr:tubulin-like doman-containing protein [Gemmataceae bacterium]
MSPIQPNAEPIPGYRLIQRIGRGGCGEVWKAAAPGGIHKAIKFVHGDLDGLDRDGNAAEQEYKSLNRVKAIRHPFILSIERFDVLDGQLVIVMELADKNLQDRFNECAAQGLPGIPQDELLRYMEEAAEALDLMNSHHQIQHLDVKPQNIFLIHQHVKVADFGLAKDLEGARAALTGGMTPMYAPPESFDGWVSRQSDQYSLAIVYQEMLTGRRPYVGSNTRQLVVQHLSAAPDVSPLPPSDRPVVLRALSKLPDERYLNCAAFIRALRAAGSAPVPVAPASSNLSRAPSDAGKKTETIRRAAAVATVVRPDSRTPNSRRDSSATTNLFSRPSAAGNENGVLTPVLVIGIGGTGLAILRQLRRLIQDRYDQPTLPNFRWLFIDTDPAVIDDALAGPPDATLTPNEVLLAPLHPPAHYQDRPELSSIDTPLTVDTLRQLPPDPATHGVRGLGWLALRDLFPKVRERVRAAVEAFTGAESVLEADRLTRLGARSGSPRVFLAASLSGGTGSGMLIDLAYLVRRELRHLGLNTDHLNGLLAVPTSTADDGESPAVDNARVALAELRRHDRPDTTYEVRYDPREEPVRETGRPFRRCVLFRPDLAPATAAHLVFAETLSAVGPVLRPDREPPAEHPYSTVGVRRVFWPRERMLRAVARRLVRDTLAGWSDPDLPGVAEAASRVVELQWRERRLDLALLRMGLEYGAAQKLGGPVETLIQEILHTTAGGPPKEGPDLNAAGSTLDRLTELLGVPCQNEPDGNGRVAAALEARVNEFVATAESQLASMVVSLLEQPGQRVAAAREAVRLLEARLTAELNAAVAESAGLAGESLAGYAGARETLLLPPPPGKNVIRKPTAPQDFASKVSQWVKTRSRDLRDRAVIQVYRRLLVAIPEYAHEVDLVAAGLKSLSGGLEGTLEAGLPADGVCEYLFPRGAGSFEEATDRLIEALGDSTRRGFDELVHAKLRAAGKGMSQAAVHMDERGARLIAMLLAEADRFVRESASRMSAGNALIKHFPNREDLHDYVRGLIESAAPVGPGTDLSSPTTVTILGLPGDSGSLQVGELLRGMCGDDSVVTAPAEDEILVLRECRGVRLSSLIDRVEPASAPRAPVNAELSPSACG